MLQTKQKFILVLLWAMLSKIRTWNREGKPVKLALKSFLLSACNFVSARNIVFRSNHRSDENTECTTKILYFNSRQFLIENLSSQHTNFVMKVSLLLSKVQSTTKCFLKPRREKLRRGSRKRICLRLPKQTSPMMFVTITKIWNQIERA